MGGIDGGASSTSGGGGYDKKTLNKIKNEKLTHGAFIYLKSQENKKNRRFKNAKKNKKKRR